MLFEEVRDVRQLLTPPLERSDATEGARRQVGWLSALLGNLAYHLDDTSGARTHLTTATAHGPATGDSKRGRGGHRAWWPGPPGAPRTP
ncbi:hypothetical protein [Streptomyces sp. NBC_01236]|uniref:hypothetical protein n=1 Tax=Streptomyces sp. NBC_01236 TaxID=2903789 RepID=UPI002E11046B|nr:hypothetical protein OG324_50850 [Streptomyces sp. NBC_01236]